ncbi:hypothetical protein ACLB1E_15795 [Escherichia coli]
MDRWISQQSGCRLSSVNLLIIKDNQIVYRKAWGAAKKYDGSVLMAQPIKGPPGRCMTWPQTPKCTPLTLLCKS